VINIGRNTFSPRETTIKRHQIADTLTDVVGVHAVKAGFDVNQDKILNFFPAILRVVFFCKPGRLPERNRRQLPAGFAGPGTSGRSPIPT